MAKLSAHGAELGRLERIQDKIAYMSDGKVLRNFSGHGWKLWKKVKAEYTPQQAWEMARANYENKLRENPFYADFRNAMHELVSFEDRARVMTTMELLVDDVDGCWSELNDGYNSLDLSLDDVARLCNACKAWQEEARAMKAAKAEIAAG